MQCSYDIQDTDNDYYQGRWFTSYYDVRAKGRAEQAIVWVQHMLSRGGGKSGI